MVELLHNESVKDVEVTRQRLKGIQGQLQPMEHYLDQVNILTPFQRRFVAFSRCFHAVFTLFSRCFHAVFTLFLDQDEYARSIDPVNPNNKVNATWTDEKRQEMYSLAANVGDQLRGINDKVASRRGSDDLFPYMDV